MPADVAEKNKIPITVVTGMSSLHRIDPGEDLSLVLAPNLRIP